MKLKKQRAEWTLFLRITGRSKKFIFNEQRTKTFTSKSQSEVPLMLLICKSEHS